MKYIFFVLLAISFLSTNAQTFATTSSGKKVILNQDGTWKYAEQGEYEKPCSKNHLGNLTIQNKTDNDIYFYYALYEYDKAFYTKVKANGSKTIYDLYSGNYDFSGKLTNVHSYNWKVLSELVENANVFSYIKGAIETGHFTITDCTSNELEIGN